MAEEFKTEWIRRLQQPDTRELAAKVIYEHFADQLLVLVRQQLSAKFSGRIDPEDVLQSVFRSFFSRPFELENTRSLFSLLVRLCLNKTRSSARYHQREKRDVRMEDGSGDTELETQRRHLLKQCRPTSVPVDEAQLDSTESRNDESFFDEDSFRQMALGATPEQAAVVFEMVLSLPKDLQRILNLRLEGLTAKEVANRMGVTRRTVTRKLARIHHHLKSRCASDLLS